MVALWAEVPTPADAGPRGPGNVTQQVIAAAADTCYRPLQPTARDAGVAHWEADMNTETEHVRGGVAGFFSMIGGSFTSRRGAPSGMPPTERVHEWPGARGRW